MMYMMQTSAEFAMICRRVQRAHQSDGDRSSLTVAVRTLVELARRVISWGRVVTPYKV